MRVIVRCLICIGMFGCAFLNNLLTADQPKKDAILMEQTDQRELFSFSESYKDPVIALSRETGIPGLKITLSVDQGNSIVVETESQLITLDKPFQLNDGKTAVYEGNKFTFHLLSIPYDLGFKKETTPFAQLTVVPKLSNTTINDSTTTERIYLDFTLPGNASSTQTLNLINTSSQQAKTYELELIDFNSLSGTFIMKEEKTSGSVKFVPKFNNVFSIMEYRHFVCVSLKSFTFKYPVFKGFENTRIKEGDNEDCELTLGPAGGDDLIVVRIFKGVLSSMHFDDFKKTFDTVNKNGIPYKIEIDKSKLEFLTDESDPIGLTVRVNYLTENGRVGGFSEGNFFQSIVDSLVVGPDKPLVITQEELNQGWYWGETKREGTPKNWVLELRGTRSARWVEDGLDLK